MKIKFRNFTPYIIVLNNGDVFESEGIARVTTLFTGFDENNICFQKFGKVEGLPEKEKGVLLIVSLLILLVSDRDDLVAPAADHPKCIKDKKGQIISVPGFVRK